MFSGGETQRRGLASQEMGDRSILVGGPGVFKRNLQVSHATFLRIVSLVKDSVRDSINPLTGAIREKAELKVAVGLYHLGHCGTWRTTANVCWIGLCTAKRYIKLFTAAITLHGKPQYMPGKPNSEQLAFVKRKFQDQRNISDIAMTVD